MIHSMTGYARKEFKGDWGSAVWEIRSVNQRYLETYLRLPEQLRGLEPILRERFRKQLERGKVECNLRFESQTANAPPATIASMPSTIRRSAFSLNTTQAITAVSTASRLSSSDAVDPLARVRPNISASGPSTPPKRIAPSSHGHSPSASPDGRQPRSRIRRAAASPSPLPR